MKKSTRRSIWAVVGLVGTYLVCQMIADIGATKMVEIAGVTFPAGTFVFAVTFTVRDMVHRRLGRTWARISIAAAALFNIFMSAYLMLAAWLPAPAWFQLGDAWNSIFQIVPAITIGSIAAEFFSESVDTEVYHFWRHKLPKLPLWSAVFASNAVSLPLDSLIFAVLGFVILPPLFGAEGVSFAVAWGIVAGQILWKGVVTVASLPLIYLTRHGQGLVFVEAVDAE